MRSARVRDGHRTVAIAANQWLMRWGRAGENPSNVFFSLQEVTLDNASGLSTPMLTAIAIALPGYHGAHHVHAVHEPDAGIEPTSTAYRAVALPLS